MAASCLGPRAYISPDDCDYLGALYLDDADLAAWRDDQRAQWEQQQQTAGAPVPVADDKEEVCATRLLSSPPHGVNEWDHRR